MLLKEEHRTKVDIYSSVYFYGKFKCKLVWLTLFDVVFLNLLNICEIYLHCDSLSNVMLSDPFFQINMKSKCSLQNLKEINGLKLGHGLIDLLIS